VVGRYALYGAIAAGGMATVHLGRLLGPVGFSRTVAIKRLHAQFAADPEFVSMFLDEARLAARIRHPNVVPTLDVVATGGELFLVMEYVPGESLARLSRALRDRRQDIPLRVLSATIAGVLHGLHAAHEARDEHGQPLSIVHRDVSPQNVLLGTDGAARVLDFGVAKAGGRVQTTKEGQIKGKLAYMPPEQLQGADVSRQTDIYAAGVMLWELVTGARLFGGDNEGAIVAKILSGKVEPASRVLARRRGGDARGYEVLDATILRAVRMQPEHRYATAREMAIEIERTCPPATAAECADWVEDVARDVLTSRAALVAEIESTATFQPAAGQTHVMTVLQGNATLPVEPPAFSPLPPHPSVPGVAPAARVAFAPPYVEGPPITQPSSMSVSTGAHPADLEPRRGRNAALSAILGLLLGAAVVAGALLWRRSSAADAEPAPTAIAVAGAASAAPPSSAEPALSEGGAPAPLVLVGPSFEAEPVDAAASAPKRPGAARPRAPAVRAPAAAADDCTTPYWYDASGVKHYKPQCLGR
jgi:serine/threonine-protein kinase